MEKPSLLALFFVMLVTVHSSWAQPGQNQVAPPNQPAEIKITLDKIQIRYAGQMIFEGSATTADKQPIQSKILTYETDGKVEQLLQLSAPERRGINLYGLVMASHQSFACEADRPSRGPLLVRHVSGYSMSQRNRAVYDRAGDWVLSIDSGSSARIFPDDANPQYRPYHLQAQGPDLTLRFRPRFYQRHRGLSFYEPWKYPIWQDSVAGWISWFAFRDRVTEKDILETAETVSEVLRPFGYTILQIDDGYQSGRGLPDTWLKANAKFPGGLKELSAQIKARGLTPGLWTGVTFEPKDFAFSHPDWFVRDREGQPARGNWIDYAVDASSKEAVDNLVRPIYRGLREAGWDYFKLDALRHLRYEGYNANIDHFRSRHLDPAQVYRQYVQAVRDEIGSDTFLLGCWGIRPELAGLINACRIGDDGFSYAGLSQYNSFNNVIWRNDPDHIELNEEGYRSALVTTLTGSLLMLTDKPTVYRTAAVEPAKRVAPVLFTVPGQLYDVDPSRSSMLGGVDTEISGSGPRLFDAGYTPACSLYLLEIGRPFDEWVVLGRTGEEVQEIRFSDLGLEDDREWLVFEFWTKKLLGSFAGSFRPGPLDPVYKSQAFCIRERKPFPQLLATNRHVTCGGVDLEQCAWDNKDGIFSGKSKVVAGDPYILYLNCPSTYIPFPKCQIQGATFVKIDREGTLLRVQLEPGGSGEISWELRFSPLHIPEKPVSH
jgi:alpha-galactosidase